jgi:hypothetical protein
MNGVGCSVSGAVPKSIITKLDFSNPHLARLVLQTLDNLTLTDMGLMSFSGNFTVMKSLFGVDAVSSCVQKQG